MTPTSRADVDRIARAAAAAFASTSRSTPDSRAAWLRGIADALDARADELVAIADDETALGSERLAGELDRTTRQLRMFADVAVEGSYLEAAIDHADPAARPPRPDLRRMLRPVGAIAVFAASNFPFAFSIAGGDTASALAVGCPVVVKAHAGHAALSRRVAAIVGAALRDAGAPAGIFDLVEGRDAGVTLIEHPAIRAAAFTGSLSGGRALADRAAARPDPIPFFGELGSVNPVVVTPGADRERGPELAAGLATSFQLGAGQFCTKPGLVFVPRDSRLEAALADLVDGAPRRLLTDAIDAGFRSGVERVAGIPSATIVAGAAPAAGEAPRPLVVALDAADLLHPERGPIIRDEVFGPVTILLRFDDARRLPDVLATLEGSLTATVHRADGESVDAILDVLEDRAGRVLFQGWPTGVAVTWSQHHGGPWPATTSQHTSVGATAVRRFLRPIAYQDAPEELLPAALRDSDPLGIPRRVNGVLRVPETGPR